MAAHSSILAWEIPWTEETGWLQSTELQRVRHDLEAKQQRHRLENLIQVVFKCIQIKEMHGTEDLLTSFPNCWHTLKNKNQCCTLRINENQCTILVVLVYFLTLKWKSLSHVWLFATLRAIQSMDFPGQNTGVGSCSLLQGNLLNPGIEPRSPALQADSLPAEPQKFA